MVTPVFGENSPDLLFFVAARGHHADIGGIAPGSMSPKATRIEEEGVYIDPFKLVARGRFREDEVRKLLTESPYPARNPEQNIADLKAQVAANEKGAAELRTMVRHYGLATVRAYMGHVQDNAAEAVSRMIASLKSSNSRSRPIRAMSSRSPSRSTARRAKRRRLHRHQRANRRHVQRAGADHAGLRALVFRTLVEDDIPLNAGCLKPIKIVVPNGSMLKPRYPAAVAAGNVETSQTIVNCLYGALGCSARRKAP